jgi:hypothetical protein
MNRVEHVHGLNLKEIPKQGETIKYDMNIEYIVPRIKDLKIYYIPKEVCPYNRGNWILDFEIREDDGNIGLMCIKLPKEMKEEEVLEWTKPLLDALEKFKKEKMN